MASGVAPVKPEYVRKAGVKVVVEAVLGSSPAAGAAAEPDAGGKHQPQTANKRSRRQQQKDRKEARATSTELCSSFAHGRCRFGDSCRFAHDVAAYIAARPPDLPGGCPFSAASSCPYGITCRWASKHATPDQLTQQYLIAPQPLPQQNGSATASAAADPATGAASGAAAADDVQTASTPTEAAQPVAVVRTEATGGPAQPAEDATWVAGSTAPLQRSSETAASAAAAVAPAADAAAVAVPTEHAHLQQRTPADSGGDAAQTSDAAWLNGVNGGSGATVQPVAAAPRTEELPVAVALPESSNTLPKDVQIRLRKNTYDFSRADGVLAALGVKAGRQVQASTAKAQRRQQQQQQQSQQQSQQQQSNGTAQRAAVAAAADAELSGDEAPAAVAAEPAAKRQRLDAANASHAEAAPDQLTGTDSATANGALDTAGRPAPPAKVRPALDGSTAPAAAAPAVMLEDTAAPPQPLFDIRAQAASGADAADGPLRPAEKKRLNLRGKSYLAPLTTVGNLPFRRVCKGLGVDVTCGEMAMATNLIQGQTSEWALLRRHPCEDLFGVQICGGFPDAVARCCQLLDECIDVDFVDINMGCPIDLVCNKGAGSALLQRPGKMADVVRAASRCLSAPLTFKTRKGYNDGKDIAHDLLPQAQGWGAAAVTLHGRTRQQRYSKLADWEYIQRCASAVPEGFQVLGNGDVYNYEQWESLLGGDSGLATLMIGRAALIKPWIFTEIKERRHWDISAQERLELFKDFCAFGLTHWGSDSKGVETTRRFLLEWLSFTHRYIPVGLLETASQAAHLNWRNPGIVGRSDLETLLASDDPRSWVAISERLLGPPPPGFRFQPKHKAQTSARSEADMALAADDGANG